MKVAPPPVGWLTGLAALAALAVAWAGVRGITGARRSAREQAERVFHDETVARARAIEARLGAIRSDLAFVAASSSIGRLDASGEGSGAAGEEGAAKARAGAE